MASASRYEGQWFGAHSVILILIGFATMQQRFAFLSSRGCIVCGMGSIKRSDALAGPVSAPTDTVLTHMIVTYDYNLFK